MELIDTQNLSTNYKPLGKIDYTYNPGEHILLFSSKGILYFLIKYPAKPMLVKGVSYNTDEPGYNLDQFEIPMNALPWLIDTIEKKFWKKASEGGLAGDVLHVDNEVEGENLRIRFSPNCGDEGIQGFTVENYSRKGRYVDWMEMQLPYTLLREDGMLDLLKDIANKHQEHSL